MDWDGVVKKAKRALDEYYIGGITTNIPLHKEIVEDDAFKRGEFDTSFLDERVEQYALLNKIAPNEEKHSRSLMARLIQKGLVTLKGDFT